MVHYKEPIGVYRKNRHVGLFVFWKKHIKNYWIGSYPTLGMVTNTAHTLVMSSVVETSLDKGNALSVCSFLLTSEEKEPKKNATPKPLQRGFSLFRGETLSIKVLVWLAKPVPYGRAMISATTRSWLLFWRSQNLIPCLNTEGFCRAAGGE